MPIEHYEIDTDLWAVVPRAQIEAILEIAESCPVLSVGDGDILRAMRTKHATAPSPEPVQPDFPDKDAGFGGQPLIWEDDPEQPVQPKPGDAVSVDISTCDGDAGARCFGTIVDRQQDGGTVTWLCELDHFNQQPAPRPTPSEQLEIKTLSTQLHAVTELLRAREREIAELKQPVQPIPMGAADIKTVAEAVAYNYVREKNASDHCYHCGNHWGNVDVYYHAKGLEEPHYDGCPVPPAKRLLCLTRPEAPDETGNGLEGGG